MGLSDSDIISFHFINSIKLFLVFCQISGIPENKGFNLSQSNSYP